MANVVTMPRQGNTVESCVLVGWRVAEGARVAASDIICEVETDKAVFEVPAGFDGVLLKHLAGEGDDVPVLAPIAVIGEKGEDWSAAVVGAGGGEASLESEAGKVTQQSKPSSAGGSAVSATSSPAAVAGTSAGAAAAAGVSPRARALASAEAVEASTLAGSGPGGRVIERDVRAALDARAPLGAAARAAIAAGGASGALVPTEGSGIGGRVRLADMGAGSAIEASAPTGSLVQAGSRAASAPGAFAPSTFDFPGPLSELPIKGIRKVIAERMHDSLSTTAQYTLHATASATRLQALRARLKASPEALGLSKVTVGDLVLFAVSRVLRDHPMCNAHKLGDRVRVFERVHLGLAVDTPRGLMVPVLRNADLLSLAEISREAKRLASACIEGRISPDELSGSTFTVSNLGGFGVDYFTPVINAPEVCVLGVGAILPRPTEGADGVVGFVPGIALSLTSDHQVVDGAPGARFLKDIGAAIADIDLTIAR
ncbi:MAG TPA: dihydrolipoamide acetyltransferase family protein [Rectinemataceae bacterium]|nr:dihydrolipoamide acetyltransferase family protein [Rectinemataceae bacterium]